MAFEIENHFYEKNKSKFLKKYEGKFVTILGNEIGGVYESFEDALNAGYEKFGLSQFMLRKIEKKDPVVLIPFVSVYE